MLSRFHHHSLKKPMQYDRKDCQGVYQMIHLAKIVAVLHYQALTSIAQVTRQQSSLILSTAPLTLKIFHQK